jgi:hypothetical protein
LIENAYEGLDDEEEESDNDDDVVVQASDRGKGN